jgi:hypothetical protein
MRVFSLNFGKSNLRAMAQQGTWQPHFPKHFVKQSLTHSIELSSGNWVNGNAIATQLMED